MIWYILDACILVLLIKLTSGEDVKHGFALCLSALTTLTMFGLGELGMQSNLLLFSGMTAGVGALLALLVCLLCDVKPLPSMLVGLLFTCYRLAVAFLLAQ